MTNRDELLAAAKRMLMRRCNIYGEGSNPPSDEELLARHVRDTLTARAAGSDASARNEFLAFAATLQPGDPACAGAIEQLICEIHDGDQQLAAARAELARHAETIAAYEECCQLISRHDDDPGLTLKKSIEKLLAELAASGQRVAEEREAWLELNDPTPATPEWFASLKVGLTAMDNRVELCVEDGDLSLVHVDLGIDGKYETVELSRVQLAIDPTRGQVLMLLAALGRIDELVQALTARNREKT